MTRPIVSATAEELYSRLRAISKTDERQDWLQLLVCDAVTAPALDPVLSLSRDTDAGPGWSALLDLDRCPPQALPWLGYFAGVITLKGTPENAVYNRETILEHPGYKRGRPATMLAAVQRTLTGSKLCVIHERDTSAFHATIDVWASQMPSEAATRAAIAASKPGDVVIDLNIRVGPTYGETKVPLPASPKYSDREARFPTYGDIQEYTP